MQCPTNKQERAIEMKSKLQMMSKVAVPALLVAMMGGCASVGDLEKVQQQVDEVRATASSANATATNASATATSASAAAGSAITTAKESKALASNALNTANAASATSASAEKVSSEASGLAAAAAKNSEVAVGVAMQTQQSVKDATIVFPVMRVDPATGQPTVKWLVWPDMSDYKGTPITPVVVPAAPVTEVAPAASGK
jgi:hypothetical protein